MSLAAAPPVVVPGGEPDPSVNQMPLTLLSEDTLTAAGGAAVQSQSVTVSVTDPIEAARVYQKVMRDG